MSISYALATPSYSGDLERCRLLCDSIDRFVTGHSMHYLLVEDRDLPLFRPLAGPRRAIIAESQLLPAWLKAWPDPFSLGRRRVWTSLGALRRGVPPLRGWHTQQLRKLAFPLASPEDRFVFADSDMIFLRPFDLGSLSRGEALRLYAKPDGISGAMPDHVLWCQSAARMLGLPKPAFPSTDYIGHIMSWRRDTVLAMMAHIEARSGRDWISTIAAHRQFSEYVIYGQFVERLPGPQGAAHWADDHELCKAFWGGAQAGRIRSLSSFEEVLEDRQVAVAVQSFIGVPMARLRALFDAQGD